MRQTTLPFALPDVDHREVDAVREVIESGWLTTGARAREFESRFAAQVGARHAVAVTSGTAALHLALEATGIHSGDEVITVPYTFAATAEVIRYFDARPVFVDIDRRSLNIDPDRLSAAITGRTRAVISVDIGGLAADYDAIRAAAGSIPVIDDAAHAFPATYRGLPVGSIADVTCFSFYATKTLTTGEGGMLTTNDASIADRCRIMSLHGLSRDAWKRYQSGGSWRYDIVAPGFKYNMTDVAAAMGLVQLDKAEAMRNRREAIAAIYDREFSSRPDVLELPSRRTECVHAWHLYPLRLHLERLQIGRDIFIEELGQRRIATSVHFIPLHLHSYYVETYGYRPEDFPVAHAEYLREISLPIYSRMSDDDVEDVVGAVLDLVERNAR